MFEFKITFDFVMNTLVISGLAISYFTYKSIKRKHASDPDYEKQEEERIRILRAKQKENDELDAYISQDDYDE